MNLNHIVVITDVKFDDVLALHVLFKWLQAREDNASVSIVITNVRNVDGAKRLVSSLFGQDIPFFLGDRQSEAKSHEDMFDNFQGEEKPFRDGFPEIGGATVFALAPLEPLMGLIQGAGTVYLGLGYNSRGIALEQLNAIPDLVVMNNVSKDIYTDGDGGRFEANDEEIWSKLPPAVSSLKEFALRDSVRFMVRQVKKYGLDLNEDNVLDSLDVIRSIKDQENPYIQRIIDQLERRTVDIECTDGQHMALWLKQVNLNNVRLNQTKYYIEVRESTGEGSHIRCPVHINRNLTRETFLTCI